MRRIPIQELSGRKPMVQEVGRETKDPPSPLPVSPCAKMMKMEISDAPLLPSDQ